MRERYDVVVIGPVTPGVKPPAPPREWV